MSHAGQAVFLSYASQDAEAARRICDALRVAGVEVWFDQSELRGGDAWDAKIRKQIKECALFVPVISANTQARGEGYFRLEWKLAVDRSHLMARDQPFLVPVVVDDTAGPAARVPEEFHAVQWTRLRGDEHTDQFSTRVKALLDRSVPNADATFGPPSANSGRASHTQASTRPRNVKVSHWLIPSCIALVAVIAVALWWRRDANSAAPAGAATAAARNTAVTAAAPATALSPARQLVEKARLLYEPWDLATKDDLVLADQFLKRAVELDPTDGEVWAAQALVSCAFAGRAGTPEDRRVEMRLQAERALKLAPNSDTARLAWAYAVRLEGKSGAWEQAEPVLRDLVARNPDNKMMLRGLGYPLAHRAATPAEGLAVLQRAAALPGGDAVAEFNIGQVHMLLGGKSELGKALHAFDRSLKLAPRAHRTHSSRIELLLRYVGDLPAARQALREVPESVLREDRVAGFAIRVLLASGEPDAALRVLNSTYSYLNASVFTGPAAYLKGVAHRQAGRESAATTEWNVALKEIQRRLDATPTARNELLLKAATLAYLRRDTEAAEVLQLYEQLVPRTAAADLRALAVKAHLGRIPGVIRTLENGLRLSRNFRALASHADFILFDPELAPLRAHPDYAALAEKARSVYADVQLK